MFDAVAATMSGSSIRPDGHDAAEALWDVTLSGIVSGQPA